jgi:hypothetical protein
MDSLGSWTAIRAAAIHEAAHVTAAHHYGVNAVSTHLDSSGYGHTILPPIDNKTDEITIALTGGIPERSWAKELGATSDTPVLVAGNGMALDQKRARELALECCGQDRPAAMAVYQRCDASARPLIQQRTFWPLVEGLAEALEAMRDLDAEQIQSTIVAIEAGTSTGH